MKRGWLAAAILAGMVLLSVWHVRTVVSFTGGLADTLREAQTCAVQGDWEEAERLTQHTEVAWKSKECYLYITLNHAAADEISLALAETESLLRSRELADYEVSNRRLVERLLLLGEREKPTIQNLL